MASNRASHLLTAYVIRNVTNPTADGRESAKAICAPISSRWGISACFRLSVTISGVKAASDAARTITSIGPDERVVWPVTRDDDCIKPNTGRHAAGTALPACPMGRDRSVAVSVTVVGDTWNTVAVRPVRCICVD